MWQWKTGALFSTACLVASTPALSETSREAAEIVAARHARTCYVEMMDGQLNVAGVREGRLPMLEPYWDPAPSPSQTNPQHAMPASRPGYSNGEASRIKPRSPSMWRPGS